LKRLEEELRLKAEIAVSDARAKVIDDFEQYEYGSEVKFKPDITTNVSTPLNDVLTDINAVKHKCIYTQPQREFNTLLTPNKSSCQQPLASPNHGNGKVEVDVLSKLADLLTSRQDDLPRKEPEVFSGNIYDYPAWIRSFEILIEDRKPLATDRLYYLRKYTSGEAKTAVQGLLTLDTTEAYIKAKQILAERYGNPLMVADTYRKKINDWPYIKYGNSIELRRFSDFLQHCQSAMNTVNYLVVLNDPEEHRKILRKLPKSIGEKWLRIVDGCLTDPLNQSYPSFSQLCSFISKEARIACSPLNVNYDDSKTETKTRSGKKWTATKSLATATGETKNTQGDSATQTGFTGNLKRCVLCKETHDLVYYPINNEDVSVDTSPRLECATSHRVEIDHQRDSSLPCSHSLIIPVFLHHKSVPNQQATVYALLDPQSDSCFITKSMMEKIGVNGPNIQIKLSTMLAEKVIECNKIDGLVVMNMDRSINIALPAVFSRECIPASHSQIARPDTVSRWPHLMQVSKYLPPFRKDIEIGLLIGMNCPRALKPREVIPGDDDDPYAVRTDLGWGVIGVMNSPDYDLSSYCQVINTEGKRCHFTYRTQVKEISPLQVNKMFEQDFNERKSEDKISLEDRQFLQIVTDGIHQREDGHFEMPLPFREPEISLPNSRAQAEKRLQRLKYRLLKDDQLKTDYVEFMSNIIDSGYAEAAPHDKEHDNDLKWYIPHYGVYNPNKPGKVRVVFDCSVEYQGQVLNHHLLQGPDLLNNLTGVLCRLQKEPVAIICDIEAMFMQVGVDIKDRNYLGFLWWKDGDLTQEPSEYRMTVHLFGATSSPACANFALKTTADVNEDESNLEAADFVRNDFYMDDGLKSVPDPTQAINLIESCSQLCAKGGFKLHKFASNDKRVVENIPVDLRAKDIQSFDICHDNLPVERALGVYWCLESDIFQFRIKIKDKPFTRRGILSTVSSIFDPLGLVSPVLLMGKRILQRLTKDGMDWDDPVPEDTRSQWERWRHELSLLACLKVRRCYKGDDIVELSTVEMHHFSDASLLGYGQCSYLRLQDNQDSKVVLGYIANKSTRFHIFVANRVQKIQDHTQPSQWRYIESKKNPADIASRGSSADDLIHNSIWWKGPVLLSTVESQSSTSKTEPFMLDNADPEIKKTVSVLHTSTIPDEYEDMLSRVEYFSDWHRLKRAIAVCLRFKQRLIDHKISKPKVHLMNSATIKQNYIPVNVDEMQQAEKLIIKMVQSRDFADELQTLRHRVQELQVLPGRILDQYQL
ncbi:uncharacterized protein LOC102809485, partial [Saccoglossus kowalevskii]|uniref:Uncharacterized protein LOC102809485 n=1 Tax=Saccoglossus kowalevskii TaxID=10224 RepID=A0ABM0MB70_SACKO